MFAVFVPESKNEESGFFCGFWCGHLNIGDKEDAIQYQDSEEAFEAGRIVSLLLGVDAHIEAL